jgi:hypothetical protein
MAIDRTVLLDASGRPLPRPVVYLDQYTLSYAYDGSRGIGDASEANAELADLVVTVARTGTLCVSVMHLAELANRPHADALGLAAWLDRLPLVWFRTARVAEAELEAEVRRRLGSGDAALARLPINQAMTAALYDSMHTVRPAGTVEILRDPTIVGWLRQAQGKLDSVDYAAQSLEIATRFHIDRSNPPPGATPEQLARIPEAKIRAHYVESVRAVVDARPIAIGDPRTTDAEIERLAEALIADPGALPLNKITEHMLHNVGDRIAEQSRTSGKFQARYHSFAVDVAHALAGAVVDVFTCDSFADDVMSTFRTSRGMERQISVRGGRDRAAFVAELRRQCALPFGAPGRPRSA